MCHASCEARGVPPLTMAHQLTLGHFAMRIRLTLSLLSIMACTVRADMNSHQFTERYAKKLQELYPQLRVTIDGDLALSVKIGDSYSAQHWLNNSFAEYQSSPETFDAIVARYGKAVLPK